ncbi:aspartate/glutamate racemase family protein [Dokdonella sp.]|uniref:aspartate/glutamate racemase family protein n=1 Tax=Dokdonella sp. TaxID=2291710 RepID=UPI003C3388DD
MKTIGLIGGMSWESSLIYYRLINERVKGRCGGLHSARLILYSVDFDDIDRLQRSGDWSAAGQILADAGCALEAAGANFLVLCTNTMHKVSAAIEEATTIPLLHVTDATARAIRVAGLSRIGLLGTQFTMEQDFYRNRLSYPHGVEVITPEPRDREHVHRVIYEELCLGTISDTSRELFQRIITSLVARGAQGIVLGCTEIGLLMRQEDVDVPLFDTTAIHAHAAAERALMDMKIANMTLR